MSEDSSSSESCLIVGPGGKSRKATGSDLEAKAAEWIPSARYLRQQRRHLSKFSTVDSNDDNSLEPKQTRRKTPRQKKQQRHGSRATTGEDSVNSKAASRSKAENRLPRKTQQRQEREQQYGSKSNLGEDSDDSNALKVSNKTSRKTQQPLRATQQRIIESTSDEETEDMKLKWSIESPCEHGQPGKYPVFEISTPDIKEETSQSPSPLPPVEYKTKVETRGPMSSTPLPTVKHGARLPSGLQTSSPMDSRSLQSWRDLSQRLEERLDDLSENIRNARLNGSVKQVKSLSKQRLPKLSDAIKCWQRLILAYESHVLKLDNKDIVQALNQNLHKWREQLQSFVTLHKFLHEFETSGREEEGCLPAWHKNLASLEDALTYVPGGHATTKDYEAS